jgi:hypothetical protein
MFTRHESEPLDWAGDEFAEALRAIYDFRQGNDLEKSPLFAYPNFQEFHNCERQVEARAETLIGEILSNMGELMDLNAMTPFLNRVP